MGTKFNHNDSFRLMFYRCEKCGDEERIWNGRDAISPFCVPCTKCDGLMQHINWHLDEIQPFYQPLPGSRYLADFTPERAKETAIRRIRAFEGTEFEVKPNTTEYAELLDSLTNTFLTDPMSMDLLTVPQEEVKMPMLSVIKDIDKSDNNPLRKVPNHDIIEIKSPIIIGTLEKGMVSGKTSIVFIFELPDGKYAFVKTSLAIAKSTLQILNTIPQ